MRLLSALTPSVLCLDPYLMFVHEEEVMEKKLQNLVMYSGSWSLWKIWNCFKWSLRTKACGNHSVLISSELEVRWLVRCWGFLVIILKLLPSKQNSCLCRRWVVHVLYRSCLYKYYQGNITSSQGPGFWYIFSILCSNNLCKGIRYTACIDFI